MPEQGPTINHRDGVFTTTKGSAGFTLLELAIVLVVIGVLLAIGSWTLTGINEEASRKETRQTMNEASAAVETFSLTNNRLPCPANPALGVGDAGFGEEDCSRASGAVPHEALLLSAAVVDAFHRPIVYSVYRNAVTQADLATATELISTIDEPSPVVNVHDFCQALRNSNPAAASAFASTSTSTTTGGCLSATFVNQAFVLSSAAFEDTDGDGNPFDGYNADATALCFASPQQGRSALYDDLVIAVDFSTVLGKVCS